MKKFCVFALQVGIVALVIGSWAHAQSTSGLITGTITDSAGAVIPDAQLVLTNQASGVQRKVTTDSSGHYSVPELQPGVYDVLLSKEGFGNEKLSNVHPEVNQGEVLDFKMSVYIALAERDKTKALFAQLGPPFSSNKIYARNQLSEQKMRAALDP